MHHAHTTIADVNPWRARINRWLEPMAARMPLSPDLLTTLALTLSIAAAGLLAAGAHDPRYYLFAVGVIAVAGSLDALDGAVARTQNKTSRLGDFLDHLFDRISDGFLLIGWCLGSGVRMSLALLALLAISMNGYIGTQMEATLGKRDYDAVGRGEFVLGLVIMPLVAFSLAKAGLLRQPFAGLTVPEWMTAALALAALAGFLQRFMQARRLLQQ